MDDEKYVNAEVAETLGVSHEAYDQVVEVVGHLPSMAELSTLLAMWQSNGCQQSLYGWLKGQHHVATRDTYIYNGSDPRHKEIREPVAKECIDIAHTLSKELSSGGCKLVRDGDNGLPCLKPHQLIYQVGKISTDFLNSEYATKYLHIAGSVDCEDRNDDNEYIEMVTAALATNSVIADHNEVGRGGIFITLIQMASPQVGFDILTCREVRLDAFLFGEEDGRHIVTLTEENDDLFLQKMTEARLDCCFLGRTTKGRIIVDGMDFGTIQNYT